MHVQRILGGFQPVHHGMSTHCHAHNDTGSQHTLHDPAACVHEQFLHHVQSVRCAALHCSMNGLVACVAINTSQRHLLLLNQVPHPVFVGHKCTVHKLAYQSLLLCVIWLRSACRAAVVRTDTGTQHHSVLSILPSASRASWCHMTTPLVLCILYTIPIVHAAHRPPPWCVDPVRGQTDSAACAAATIQTNMMCKISMVFWIASPRSAVPVAVCSF